MVREIVIEREFAGADDRTRLVAAFERRIEEVVAAIEPERLLVYRVTEGWAPLCAFLGYPVPAEPFPHKNDRASFAARSQASPD
jgi:hypothetical protein